jgi:2,5-diketo-D-gluconate reductase B
MRQKLVGDAIRSPAMSDWGKMSTPTTVSAHGAEIPVMGFGTSGLGRSAAELVAIALRLGYRHIDTARKYGTERGVGDGIRASGVPREEIFLTTKVSHENLRPADFARSVETSLDELKVDYVDLLLIHWPNPQIRLAECMAPLAAAKREGLARHIGVANFTVRLLEEAIRACPEPLVTNQVECHPYLDQTKMIAALRQHGMALTAHCPLGRGRLMGDPVLCAIAHQRKKTLAQIALRWLIQQEIIAAIPRSANPERIAENLDVFDFRLTGEEMDRISALRRPDGRVANPAFAPQWD